MGGIFLPVLSSAGKASSIEHEEIAAEVRKKAGRI
jgi:hypothetical protein